MHSTEINNVPAFLIKLWRLVEDENYNHLIGWNETGVSFYIRNHATFAKEVLPMFYKHSNMASFVRQLNMYGFHKVVSMDQGALRADRDEMEFQHQYFLKGEESLLEHIKRKVPMPRASVQAADNGGQLNQDMMNHILTECKLLKHKQENMEAAMSKVKNENEVMWRELVTLRQNNNKQKQIVTKLIQFLISIVQQGRNSSNVGGKRKLPLMIGDAPRGDKVPRLSRHLSYDSASSSTHTGPVIHDITDSTDLEHFLPSTSSQNLGGPDINEVAEEQEVLTTGPLLECLITSEQPDITSHPDVVTDLSLEDTVPSSPLVEMPKTPASVRVQLPRTPIGDEMATPLVELPETPDQGVAGQENSDQLDDVLSELINIPEPSTSKQEDGTAVVSFTDFQGKMMNKSDFIDHYDYNQTQLDNLGSLLLNGNFDP